MRKIISLLAGLVLSFSIQAQTNSIKHMDVYLKPVIIDMVSYHSPQMLIDLADTATITNIEVNIGSTEGGSDIASKNFVYNQEGEFEDGTSYVRDGNIIQLNLGTINPIQNYFARARVRYSDGSYSETVTFNQ